MAGGEGGMPDIFSTDEDTVDGLLRSLIDTNGIQSAWQQTGRRLQVLEQSAQVATQRLDRLPEEYVGVTEFQTKRKEDDKFKKSTNDALRDHKGQLESMDTHVEDFEDKLQNLEERFDVVSQWQEQNAPMVRQALDSADSLEKRTEQRLRKIQSEIEENAQHNADDFKRTKADAEEQMAKMRRDIEDMERRTQMYTEAQVKKVLQQMYSQPEEADGENGAPAEPQHSPQQALMLEFVSANLLAPLSRLLEETREQLTALTDEFWKTKEHTDRDIRIIENTHLNEKVVMQDTTNRISADLNLRATKRELKDASTDLKTQVTVLKNDCGRLAKKLDEKSTELLCHVGAIKDAIEAHEQHLAMVNTELDDRSRRNETEMCRKLIDKCTRKEEFELATKALRETLHWQTGKIEGFGLTMNALNNGKLRGNAKRYRLRGGSTSMSVMSGVGAPSSRLSIRSEVGGKGSLSPHEQLARQISGTVHKAAKDSDDETRAGDSVQNMSKSELDKALSRELANSDEETLFDANNGMESSSEDEDDFVGGGTLMRQQLEALSMALVGLGYLTLLREPKLGMAREVRLKKEKDMMDELHNLRHWVTNRVRPSGWDPAKIVTLALSCAHPREDEVRRKPLPQLSLKAIMQEGEEHRRPHRALADLALLTEPPPSEPVASEPMAPLAVMGPQPSPPGVGGPPAMRPKACAPLTARARMATSALVSKHLAKAPLSARGPDEALGCVLPPLSNAAVVA